MNRFRAVTNTLPRRYDISQWNEDRFLQFFELVNAFTEEGTIKIKSEVLLAQEQKALSGTYPFLEEMFHRMNQFTTDPNATPRKFYMRFTNVVRNVGEYIKLNPSKVTDPMRAIIEPNPRMAWMLNHYKIKETKMGIKVVDTDNLETVDRGNTSRVANPKDPQLQILESMLELTDALKHLTKGITQKDIKKLSVKDRITLSSRIIELVSKGKSYKPNIGTFKQIVIHKADRDDLEKAILDMNQE